MVALGLTVLVVAAIFVLLLVSAIRLRNDTRAGRHYSDLITQSFTVEGSVLDIETGLRGFLLTGERRFLAPYRVAVANLPVEERRFRALAQTAGEHRAVSTLSGTIGRYLTVYAEPLAAGKHRVSGSDAVAVTALGKQLVDDLRTQFDNLNGVALRLRNAQRASASSSVSASIAAAAVGLGASVLLLLGFGAYLLRRLLRPMRTVAAAASKVAAGAFETRVPEVGRGEVLVLADSFNRMAEALGQARHRLEEAVEDARTASALKSSFLANMSHEIRTPLNGLIGMISLLGETTLTAEQREYIEAASSSSEALLTVVSDVLDIARIEAGRLELERLDFDLHELVETDCEVLAASALLKGLQLQSYIRDDVPRAVHADRTRIGQILTNLISNAVKFTHNGEVLVEVSNVASSGDQHRVSNVASSGDWHRVRFEVRDTGIGIEPSRLANLFQPFTQADPSTSRQFGGTGLGLSISRQLAELMGGTVGAESELGRGSVFWCEIPLVPAKAELVAPVPPAVLEGLRVLVLDDNATNRRILEAYVESSGMRVEVAGDPADAFDLLQGAAREGDPFRLALLDLNLPGENGADFARRVTATPELYATRLVMLASSASASAMDPSTGIRYHLTKPVRRSRLLDAISAVIAGTPQEPSDAQHPELPTPTGLRVLVAEDQPINWMVVERLLQRRGHVAINAADGRAVLAALESQRFDLVLMDCQMPALDGYDTTREIRRREAAERRRRVPIVAMTADVTPAARDRSFTSGMDGFLTKPIRATQLDEALARWLPGSLGGGVPDRVAAHRDATYPAIDPDRLRELLDLFPGAELPEMLRDLGDEIARELDRIAEAHSERNRAISIASHKIKNSARMIGADGVAEAAGRVAASVVSDGDAIAERPDAVALRQLIEQWHLASRALQDAAAKANETARSLL